MREVDLPTDYEQADSDLGDYDTTKPACYSVNRNQDVIPTLTLLCAWFCGSAVPRFGVCVNCPTTEPANTFDRSRFGVIRSNWLWHDFSSRRDIYVPLSIRLIVARKLLISNASVTRQLVDSFG